MTRASAVTCPTCGARPGQDCNITPSGWIGGRDYHTARVTAATPLRPPTDRDPALAPEDDPANTPTDRPGMFPPSTAHDHQDDPW